MNEKIVEGIVSILPAGVSGEILLEAFNLALPSIKILIDDNVKSISEVRLSAPVIIIQDDSK